MLRQDLRLFMITTRPEIARSDCLFYALPLEDRVCLFEERPEGVVLGSGVTTSMVVSSGAFLAMLG